MQNTQLNICSVSQATDLEAQQPFDYGQDVQMSVQMRGTNLTEFKKEKGDLRGAEIVVTREQTSTGEYSSKRVATDLNRNQTFDEGERPGAAALLIGSNRNVINTGIERALGVFARLLGAIKLADGFGTNTP